MPTKKIKTAKSENDQPVSDQKPQSLWSAHGGMDDVNYQRSAQVTLWTIMGGLAFAVLVTEMDSLWAQMQAGRWYLALYATSSFWIIVLDWTLAVWGSLVLKYQITLTNTLLIVGASFAIVMQCLLVTNPAGWFAATGVSGLLFWILQFYFMRSGAWKPFSVDVIAQLKKNLWVYGLWPLVCFISVLHLYLAPSALTETIWGVIALVLLIDAFFRRSRDMQRERKDLGIL
jgi:hypothetical protein